MDGRERKDENIRRKEETDPRQLHLSPPASPGTVYGLGPLRNRAWRRRGEAILKQVYGDWVLVWALSPV